MYILYHVHAWYLRRPEEAVRSLELELEMIVTAMWVLGTQVPWTGSKGP